jgi:hypothetical protein
MENTKSRDLYVLLCAFKILGHRKIRLPLSIKEYQEQADKLK